MYRSLVEHSPDAIVLHYNDQFLYVNPAAVKLFGAKSESDLLRHSLMEFIPKDDQQSVAEVVDKLQNKGDHVQPISLQLTTLDCKSIAVEITATAVIKHGKRIVQGMIRDVTEQNLVRELQRVNQEWKIFRSMISHLSDKTLNPLTVIEGFLTLLKGGEKISPDLLLREAKSFDIVWGKLISFSRRELSETWDSPLSLISKEISN